MEEIDIQKTEGKRAQKRKKKKQIWKKILITILIFGVIGIAIIVFLLYGPYSGFREWLITTAMTTMRHQYFATWFYDDETIQEVLDNTKAPIMYLCNFVTQPGETDGYTVSDHITLLNKYLNKKKIDVVIASNTKINKSVAERYSTAEQKEPVKIDYENIKKLGVELIEDDLIVLEDNILRHNSLKLSSLIFSYLMRK